MADWNQQFPGNVQTGSPFNVILLIWKGKKILSWYWFGCLRSWMTDSLECMKLPLAISFGDTSSTLFLYRLNSTVPPLPASYKDFMHLFASLFFQTGSHQVTKVGFELEILEPCLLSTGITGLSRHTWLLVIFWIITFHWRKVGLERWGRGEKHP